MERSEGEKKAFYNGFLKGFFYHAETVPEFVEDANWLRKHQTATDELIAREYKKYLRMLETGGSDESNMAYTRPDCGL